MYTRQVFERYLTETEERQLLGTVRRYRGPLAERDEAWMRLLRQTGLRVGTLAGLRVVDARLALKAGVLSYRPEIAKGGYGGKVFLNKRAAKALRDLLRIRREMGHAERPEGPLIMSRNHKGMSVRSFQARMRMWVQRAGLDVEASPHWWRHTLSKRVMARSTSQDPRGIVQGILNHRDPRSTAIYTLPDREDIRQAMEEAS